MSKNGQMNTCDFSESVPQCATNQSRPLNMKRLSWEYFGINKKRYLELRNFCMDKNNALLVRQMAQMADKDIWEHIYISVTQRRSFERIECARGLDRICVGRTDFYGIRRLFYHLLDEELKKNESKGSNF